MNVLSLFDGISCGQLALKRANISYDTYYASEINKHAIQVTQHHFPKTVQLGDVTKVNPTGEYHLLLAGSPCQGFSSGGKGLNFDDPRSKLFFEFVRVLREVRPKWFILENVKMEKKWADVITSYVGLEPITINSNLVSAQNRTRMYWTNIPTSQPEDKRIGFDSIVEDGWFPGAMRGRYIDPETGKRKDYGGKTIQYVFSRYDNKSNALTTVCKDNIATPNLYPRVPIKEVEYRFLSPLEYERLQTVPEGYTELIPKTHRLTALGNGWTVDVIAHILSGIK